MSRVLEVRLNGGKPLLRGQLDLLVTKPAARFRLAMGAWRSGKTRGAALGMLANCVANPWRPEYGTDRPITLAVTRTAKVLHDSMQREFRAVCPAEMLRRVQRGADERWVLANGHEIVWRTWMSPSIEGLTACGLWVDEGHLLPVAMWPNIRDRLTEPRAVQRWGFISGLPERGWVHETFAGRADDPAVLVVHFALEDNAPLVSANPGYVAEATRGLSEEDAAVYIRGLWRAAADAIYAHLWDAARHLTDDAGRPGDVVHAGLDFGEQSAALVFVERSQVLTDSRGVQYSAPALVCVDELLIDRGSAREAARQLAARVRAKGWRWDSSRSRICVDPMALVDVVQAVREEIPGVPVVQRERAELEYQREYGFRCVRGALVDADRNTRLRFWRGLPRTNRSILTGLQSYRRDPRTGRDVRNNATDHLLDCLRYVVQEVLPQVRPGQWGVRPAA